MGEDVLARPGVVDPVEHRLVVVRRERGVEPRAAGFDRRAQGGSVHGPIIRGRPRQGAVSFGPVERETRSSP